MIGKRDPASHRMRKPDLIIGPPSAPCYYRWQLFKFRGFQLCLHKWLRSDDDRALHDHSGDSISFILNHGYIEIVREYSGAWLPNTWQIDDSGRVYRDVARFRRPWWPVFRRAQDPHRVVLDFMSAPIWSLWFRWPPRREWGFHCPKGWRHWRDYLNNRGDYYSIGTSEVGPGCG